MLHAMSRGRLVLLAGAAVLAVAAVAIALSGKDRHVPAMRIEYTIDGDDRELDHGVDVIRRRIDRATRGRQLHAGVWAKERIIVELADAEPEVYEEIRTLLRRPAHLQFVRIDPEAEFFARLHAQTRLISPPGVVAETDAWPRVGDARVTSDRYLRGRDRGTLERYLAAQARVDATYTPPPDRRIAYEEIEEPGKPPAWRTHVLEDTSWLTGASIRDARFERDPQTNRPLVMVELDDAAAAKFGELTTTHVGDKLAIVLDGEILSAPLITSGIPGGRIAITTGGNDAEVAEREAHELAAVIASGELPRTLREDSVTSFETSVDGVRWHVLAPLGLLAVALAIAGMVKR